MEPDDLHQNLFHIINKMSFALANQNVVFLPWEFFPSREPQHFLLRSTARVEFPHLRPKETGKTSILWKSSLVKRFQWVNTINVIPTGLIITQKMSEKKFFNLAFWKIILLHVFRWSEGGNLDPKWQISLNLTIMRLKVCIVNWLISCGFHALILVTQHSIHDLLWSMIHHLPSWKKPQPNVFQSLFHPTKRNGHESNFAD